MRFFPMLVCPLVLSVMAVTPAHSAHQPLVDQFKGLSAISQADLATQLEKYTIVDVRTALEFETLHIQGAHNIEYPSTKFGKKIETLHQKEKKPMVFYAGGVFCVEPLQATQAAHDLFDVNEVHAYPGGISEWIKEQAGKTTYKGVSPAPQKKLISTSQYEKHLLAPMAFEEKISDKYEVLDVRTYNEREGVGIFFGHESWAPLNRYGKLLKTIKQAQSKGKMFLVFDDHGHRTQMLQYIFRDLGIKDYYFMEGGAKNYYAMVAKMHGRDYDHGQMGKHVDAHAHQGTEADSQSSPDMHGSHKKQDEAPKHDHSM